MIGGLAGLSAELRFRRRAKGHRAYGDKLDKVPRLCRRANSDTTGDGKITADKIDARIKGWLDQKIGRLPLRCKITHNGEPLVGATVIFEPGSFLART